MNKITSHGYLVGLFVGMWSVVAQGVEVKNLASDVSIQGAGTSIEAVADGIKQKERT